MSDFATEMQRVERHAHAPEVVRKAGDEHDHEQLAEVCAEVELAVREASIERDIGKHGGIACLYMVIDRLAEDGGDE